MVNSSWLCCPSQSASEGLAAHNPYPQTGPFKATATSAARPTARPLPDKSYSSRTRVLITPATRLGLSSLQRLLTPMGRRSTSKPPWGQDSMKLLCILATSLPKTRGNLPLAVRSRPPDTCRRPSLKQTCVHTAAKILWRYSCTQSHVSACLRGPAC